MPSTHAKIEYLVFSHKSIAQAMAALSKVENLDGARLIPLPTEIGEGCGYALRVNFDHKDIAKDLLKTDDYEQVFTLYHEGKKRIVEKYVL